MHALVAVNWLVETNILCHIKCCSIGSPAAEELQHVHLSCFRNIITIAAVVRAIVALRILTRGLQV